MKALRKFKNKNNGSFIEAIEFSDKTKFNIVELFKGRGEFNSEMNMEQMTIYSGNNFYTLKQGDFMAVESGNTLVAYPKEMFNSLYEESYGN